MLDWTAALPATKISDIVEYIQLLKSTPPEIIFDPDLICPWFVFSDSIVKTRAQSHYFVMQLFCITSSLCTSTKHKEAKVLSFSTVSAKQRNGAKNIHPVPRRDAGYQSASPRPIVHEWITRWVTLLPLSSSSRVKSGRVEARGMLMAHTHMARHKIWRMGTEVREEGREEREKNKVQRGRKKKDANGEYEADGSVWLL